MVSLRFVDKSVRADNSNLIACITIAEDSAKINKYINKLRALDNLT